MAGARNSSRRLRILEVVHDFPPFARSGTELYTLNLAKQLQALGHDVAVLHPVGDTTGTPLEFKRVSFEGLNVYRFNAMTRPPLPPHSDWWNPSFDEPFRSFLKSHGFDLVHFQHLLLLSAGWPLIAKELGLKTALKVDDMFFFCRHIHLNRSDGSFCSGPETPDKCFACVFGDHMHLTPEQVAAGYYMLARRQALLQSVFASFDFVQSPCLFLEQAHRQFGFTNARFHVIPTGIAPFPRPARSPDQSGRIRIAFVGTLALRKGILDYLRAVEIFQQESARLGLAIRLCFPIYGTHYGGDVFQQVMHCVARLEGVDYRGGFSPDDRAKLFADIDLVVAPSLGDNYPFLLREALHAGVPVLASAIAGVPEIVQDGHNGFLIQPRDVHGMASVFLAINQNPGLLEQLRPGSSPVKTIAQEASELSEVFIDILGACRQRDSPTYREPASWEAVR